MIVVFKAKNVGFYVDFANNPTALDIITHLPIEGIISRWGDEIYFNTGISAFVGTTTTDVEVGDVAYWPDGKALCVFFGPTEASTSNKPVPATPVVLVGKTFAPAEELREIQQGERISVFVVSKRTAFHDANPFQDTKKLSQEEIDILVHRLLEKKKHGTL